jgi:hypothetical protein
MVDVQSKPSPEFVTFTTRKGDRSWSWQLATAEVRRLRRIMMPAGEWHIEISGGRGVRTAYLNAVVVRAKRSVAVGDVVLTGLPRVSIRVVSRAEGVAAPVVGATVTALPGEEPLGQTAADGSLTFVPQGVFPDAIRVAAPGLASQRIDLIRRNDDVNLGDVELETGSSVRLSIRGAAVRSVELVARTDAAKLEAVLHERGSRNVDAEFPHVAAGHYFVLISGSGGLQKSSYEIAVGGDAFAREIVIDPVRIEGYVTRGRAPAARVSLDWFTLTPPIWRATISTDEDGHYTEEIWQHGPIGVEPRLGGPSVFFLHETIGDAPTQFCDIAIPAGAIRGRVTDSDTSAPIAAADILVTFTGSERAFGGLTIHSASDGRYALAPAESGRYTIHARAAGHVDSRPVGVELAPDDVLDDLNFALNPDRAVWLRFRDERGKPVANPYVVANVWSDGRASDSPVLGDAGGMVRLPLAGSDEKTLYAFTSGGAYARLRIDPSKGGSEDQPIDLQLPLARNGGLRVHVVAGGKAPVRGAELLVRRGEELLPPAVVELMQLVQRAQTRSGEDGTVSIPSLMSGVYDLWVFRTAAEYDRLLRSLPESGRVRVTVTDRVQEITITAAN